MNAPYTVTVLSKTVWSDTLFSFTTTRPAGFRFEAGQFVRLGINPSQLQNAPKDAPDTQIFRAYSVVSSPYDEILEFFSVVVPDGEFTSRLQYLTTGDTLFLDKQSYGYLTLSRYQEPAPDTLWLLATGTGLAPFLSILSTLEVWQNYRRIVLAYSVRFETDLAYMQTIQALPQKSQEWADDPAQFCFVPIVTRGKSAHLSDRLTKLIDTGLLEKTAGFALDAQCHVMLCGNPTMVEDTKETLKQKGLTMNRRGAGNIAVENYW